MLHDSVAAERPLIGHYLNLHHREIEDACRALLDAGLAGEPRDLARCWGDIEHQLYDHMMAEEHFLLPAYQRAEPENAQDLRDQHAWLREHAFEIGVAIQLHAVRMEQLQEFIAELASHARNEERSLHRWAEHHAPDDTRHRLRDWLAASG